MEVFPVNPTVSPEDIIAAKERFLHEGDLDDRVVRPIVAESWRHCRSIGIMPGRSVPVMLSKDQYRDKLDENKPLMEAARPILQELVQTVDEPRIIYTVTSREGYSLISAGCKEVFQEIIRKHRVRESICFGEE